MLAFIEITLWHWAGFILCVVIFLALDLRIFHQGDRIIKVREALAWTAIWITLAVLFGAALALARGRQESLQFFTGYFIELSLSMDNVFVIALIFGYFKVPAHYQHRLLFWGILGALVMRLVMILLGVALISRFDWLLYVLGAFLIVTGAKMLLARSGDGDMEKNLVVRMARKILPISTEADGNKFFARRAGQLVLTPLFLALLVVEASDVIFAVDSIPAIFGVTRRPFIVFTSNVFAVLGLRSLYSVLAGAIGLFRVFEGGAVGGAGVHRREDADRSARPAGAAVVSV